MTRATRGNVQSSVAKACARAPCRNACSTWRSWWLSNFGLRPARLAPFSARTPPRSHSLYHRLTLCRLTFRCRAIAARIILPAANKRPACLRRCSRCMKSRRGRTCVRMLPVYATTSRLSLYYARFSRSQRVSPRTLVASALARLEVLLPGFETKLSRSNPEDIPQSRLFLLLTSLVDFYPDSLNTHL